MVSRHIPSTRLYTEHKMLDRAHKKVLTPI